MNQQTILFSHANGFPLGSYHQVIRRLETEYHVYGQEILGINPSLPVTNNWPHLVEELIQQATISSQPVIAVGHSLGGVLSLMAACAEPQLFKAVILLDSPILSGIKAFALKILKALHCYQLYIPGGANVKNRRASWPSKEHMLRYCQSRALYSNFTTECMQDFVEYAAFTSENGQYELKIKPEVEFSIYRTFPDIHPQFNGITVPCCTIIGQHGTLVGFREQNFMQHEYNMLLQKVPGGHLFPFEYPQQTAETINNSIKQLLKESH